MNLQKGDIFWTTAWAYGSYPIKQPQDKIPYIAPGTDTNFRHSLISRTMRCIYRDIHKDPVKVMFIGWSWLRIGWRVEAGIQESSSFFEEKRHKVAVCVSARNAQYVKARYVLEEDIGFAVTDYHQVHGIVLKQPIELAFHSNAKDDYLRSLVAHGIPIEAIRVYRNLTNLPLVPARRHIEELK